jgi:alcohol dehydrogenase (quinone), cytochrome c subunit
MTMRIQKSVCVFGLAVAGLITLLSSTLAQEAAQPATPTASPPASAGEYLARIGNCIACHSVADGAPYAGGLKMAVPDYGHIYSTNITPDPETGIGKYTFEDFDAAMRRGVAKDGHRLFPAMPYPSYAKLSADDMRALYDYFMKEVKPVKQANQPEQIDAWINPRRLMGLWNLVNLDDDPFEKDPKQSDAWNRGAYLTEGLGHCGACHTPRGMLFAEKGMDSSDDDFLAGAPLDHWSAPSLNQDINSGLGRWSEADIAQFMKTGKNKFGSAFGTMVEVVNNSTQYMTDADLNAMAVYLKSLPANNEKSATPYKYDAATHTELSKLEFKTPGAQIYYEYCVSCHSYDGSGHGSSIPGLAGNPVVLDPNAHSLVNLTLNGSLRVVANGRPESFDMPYFRSLLSDQQIADVVNFMRTSWGNSAPAVSVKVVTEMRAATNPAPNNDVVVLKMK